ncbi:MAG: glycogen debranching enzyme N-terminal domain-containing protein [Candidatus Thermoplasmatota archaeon]|nr:glycogen debranching enzyme N-terminal domain-containing protein [Candidatus Thermoplasmatota archaeon]
MKLQEEWISVNGRGYYSYSTLSSINLRTYHGLYVTLESDLSRFVLLSKLWEEASIGGKIFSLDTNFFGDTVHPKGYQYLSDYSDFPIPTFVFHIGDSVIAKEICWTPNGSLLSVRYHFEGTSPERISIKPLLAFRKTGETNRGDEFQVKSGDMIQVSRNGKALYINNVENFTERGEWFRNFTFPMEKERGYGYAENLYSPGEFVFSNLNDITLQFADDASVLGKEHKKIRSSFARFVSPTFRENELPSRVQGILNFFLADDNIIAGFPWFGSWARDTFISIPGLLLVTGKYDRARSILESYIRDYPDGVITNFRGSDFVSSDSPLWFIYAVKKYIDYTNDIPFLKTNVGYLTGIINNYIKGFNGIGVDEFLVSVPEGTTWMDANCGQGNITPRNGKPVEVNALWFSALESLKEFYYKINTRFPKEIEELIPNVGKNFRKKFIVSNKIKDVADPDDLSSRPNMIFAFSLPYPVLDNFRQFKGGIEDLVTPLGLRSLSPSDEKFASEYAGDQCSRDAAYHNGSIWPWLAGPYITASVRSGARKDHLRDYFKGLLEQKLIPELYDGFLPEKGKGCTIQAWSYGEIVRAFIEDLR